VGNHEVDACALHGLVGLHYGVLESVEWVALRHVSAALVSGLERLSPFIGQPPFFGPTTLAALISIVFLLPCNPFGCLHPDKQSNYDYRQIIPPHPIAG
jgi:hypothetical protein